jgi:hypothetical protein
MSLKKNLAEHDQRIDHRYYYVAGHISMSAKYERQIIDNAGYKNRLLTWAYLGGVNKKQWPLFEFWLRRKKSDPEVQILMDSGAFSFGSKISEYDNDTYDGKLVEYIKFIKRYKNRIDKYICLDHIWSVDKSIEYYDRMRSEGLDPIPVYHLGEPYEILEYYAENSGYIAIALRGAKQAHQYATLQKIFNDYPNHKFHALAVNGLTKIFLDFPFYSCDSSSWCKYALEGFLPLPPGLNKYNKVILAPPSEVCANEAAHSEIIEQLYGKDKKQFFIRRQPCFIDLSKNEQDRIKKWLRDDLKMPYEKLMGKSGMETGIVYYENRGIAYLKALKVDMDARLDTKLDDVPVIQEYLFDASIE